MTLPIDRREALAVLRLPPSAGTDDVKRAYRRLARVLHPDHGGDSERFHELRVAYEALLADGRPGSAPAARRGTPSRERTDWSSTREEATEGVVLDSVRWDTPVVTGGTTLDRDRLAVLLAHEHPAGVAGAVMAVVPVTATSRAPGSRLNRAAGLLSTDLTSQLTIATARDDRGRTVVATTLTTGNRRARRALDEVAVAGGWVRTRGSSSTTLRATATPGASRRATAVRTVDALESLLDRLDWPLATWTLTDEATERP